MNSLRFSSANVLLPRIDIKPLPPLMPLISLRFPSSCFLAPIPQPCPYLLLLFLPYILQQQCAGLRTAAGDSWAPGSRGVLDTSLPSNPSEIKKLGLVDQRQPCRRCWTESQALPTAVLVQ